MKTTDTRDIKSSSAVCPTVEDVALWESLSDEQRLAIIERDEQAGFDSGVADRASLQEILTETRDEMKRGL